MPETRRVIVELRYSAGRSNLAAAVSAGDEARLDTQVVPSIAGLSWDGSYPPVELPGRIALGGPSSPFDVGPRFALDPAPANSTYLVRATVDEDQLAAATAAADADEAVVGIFSDVGIQPCLVCPGSPPLGTHTDVERLLCVEKLKACGMDGSGVLVAIVDTGVNMAYLNARGRTRPSTRPAAGRRFPASSPDRCRSTTARCAPSTRASPRRTARCSTSPCSGPADPDGRSWRGS
jgi:hypothetical protein